MAQRERTLVILSICALVCGCETPRKPRWEVSVTVGVENHPDPQTKLTGGLTVKRTIGGEEPKPTPPATLSVTTNPTPPEKKKP